MRRARLAAVQLTVRPGEKDYCLARIATLAQDAAREGADLVCFPELATTGFVRPGLRELAEPIPGPTTETLSSLARDHRCWMAVGMAEAHPDGLEPYNSVVLIDPAGEVRAVHRKILLFPGELGAFTTGDEPTLVDLPFARAGVVICYELAFPGYIAGFADRGAELILHPAAWLMTPTKAKLGYDPEGLRALGVARAAENTVWYVGANQYGIYDDSGTMDGVGLSSVVTPWARVVAEVRSGEGVAVAEVDFDSAAPWREQCAPYLADRARVDPWQV